MPVVYLIHLDKPLCHARHYLGYTALESVQDWLDRHRSSNGSRLLAACNNLGIGYQIVRTWDCDTTQQAKRLERKLKQLHNAPRLCPICQAARKNSLKK